MNDEDQVRAIEQSPSYRMAEDDPAFLDSDAARASRLALEFMRADFYLHQHRIRSTVVVFGGSRIRAPERARTPKEQAWSRYYEEARSMAHVLAESTPGDRERDFVVVTGGGPGIMEAANRGATEAGAPSVGFNIQLPHEQAPNRWITPALAFRFRYFALRKMHFLLRAKALVAFPGGYGTLDEVFESLNLVQTRKIQPIPIVLVGREHWQRVVDFDYLVEQGFIDPGERALARIVDTGVEAARVVLEFHGAAITAT
jgi:hypothetical protein